MRDDNIYPIRGELVDIVYDIIENVEAHQDNPILRILLRDLRNEMKPYNDNVFQTELQSFLAGWSKVAAE